MTEPNYGEKEVMAISAAKNNAEIIAQAARLGYLKKEWLTLDPTYGTGRFWTKWRPDHLTESDIDPACGHFSWDFTDIPQDAGVYDAVVFDPPYKLNGTPSRGGPANSDIGYGVGEKQSIEARYRLISTGLQECARVTKPGGFLLLKCQDQVSSGHVHWQTIDFTNMMRISLGWELVDHLMLKGGRAQPLHRRQVHARRNYSSLLIFQKPRR